MQFQVGDFHLVGTPNYLDPLLYNLLKHRHERDIVTCDLMKTDIFSLGLTLIEMACGLRFIDFNQSRDG